MRSIEEIQEEIQRLEKEMASIEEENNPLDDVPVYEAEVVHDDETEEEQSINLVTLIQIGITADGQFVFDVQGDRNIVIVEGLRRYFNERMKLEWASRVALPDNE